MKKSASSFGLIIALLLLASCKKVKVNTEICEITEPSYLTDILPIFEEKCAKCHSRDGEINTSFNYEDADQVADYKENGILEDVLINNQTMPPPGESPLSDCEKRVLKLWLEEE